MSYVLKQNRQFSRTDYNIKILLMIVLTGSMLLCGSCLPTALAATPNAENQLTTEPQPNKEIDNLQHTPSIAVATAKAIGALAVVIGLMVLLAAALKKLGLGTQSSQGGRLTTVLDIKMIAPKKYVAVIDIAGQTMAVGVSEQQITLLTKLEPSEQLQKYAEKTSPTSSFSALLSRAVNRNKTIPKDQV